MSSEGRAGSPARIGPVTPEEFRRACGRFATGVAIASVADLAGTPHGLTVSSFTSVSLDPPLVLICLGHEVTSIEVFRAAGHFGLSVLKEGQLEISERFARKGYDRFDGLEWERGQAGTPLLAGVLATMECRVERRVTAGDHDIFIGEMIGARVAEGEPLIYHASGYRGLRARK